MVWANFALLGIGGLMISVPILIHFLMQPKPVEVVFPAMRFLKEKQLINRSRNRLRHLLLMLLRCILIALLVMALAGPSVASQQFGKWLTFGGISFVAVMLAIVLQAINVPVEGLALIFAVDRLLDMCRTIANVTGDATVSMLVANSIGKLGDPNIKNWDDHYPRSNV